MKVLQINSVCGVGSTGRITTDIHNVLLEHGHESYIAYGRQTAVEDEHIIKIGNSIDYYIHGGLTRVFDRHALWGSNQATKEFIGRVNAIDPDVIHLHNLHGYYINIKILFDYLKESGKPVVWTLHDCWSFTGHCAHFSYVKCDKWKEGCNECPQKSSYPASVLIDNSLHNYQLKKLLFTSLDNMTIVTPSHWLADLVEQSFLSKYPVRVIHNGIDTKVFMPVEAGKVRSKYGLLDKFVILGVASTWDKRKGLNYFIKLSKMIDNDSIIMLVGLNERQIAELPSNIIGIKRTSNINELAELYSAADVFVNPTLEDNFPTVNLEALGCGTPIITFNTGGSPEAIAYGCGHVVEMGNINAMKSFIDQVRIDGKAYYLQRCMNRAEFMFEKNDRYEEYVKIYNYLLRLGNY